MIRQVSTYTTISDTLSSDELMKLMNDTHNRKEEFDIISYQSRMANLAAALIYKLGMSRNA